MSIKKVISTFTREELSLDKALKDELKDFAGKHDNVFGMDIQLVETIPYDPLESGECTFTVKLLIQEPPSKPRLAPTGE